MVFGFGRRTALACSFALAVTACTADGSAPLGELPASVGAGPSDADVGVLVVAHAGQGSPASLSDGPARAVSDAKSALDSGESALEAAILGVEGMEDDPRFNAGLGANLRMDGQTIQADAAVMDDANHFGAVAGIRGVRHPVRVAQAVSTTPHMLIVGAGAQAFADTLELERGPLVTSQAREKLAAGWSRLIAGQTPAGWGEFDWRKHWNYEVPAPTDEAQARRLSLGDAAYEAELAAATAAAEAAAEGEVVADDDADEAAEVAAKLEAAGGETQDTVGVVVRSAEGRYAAALSTGGTTLALRGRVGDVPQLGAGLYAGPHGAVAATGRGEAILREQVAAEVYRHLSRGVHPNEAIRRAIRGISPEEGVGVIAVSERGWGAHATSQMAWAARADGGLVRADEAIWR